MPPPAEFSQFCEWQLVCTVWQSLSKLWWMQGEITPEKPNFTPHKTVHQAPNCYSESILLHLLSVAVKPKQYRRHLCTGLRSDVTQSMSSFPVRPKSLMASTVRYFYWTRPHFTDCGLKLVMQPSRWCFPLLHSHSISLLLSLHTFHFRASPLSYTSFPSWRCFHSSGSYFTSLFLSLYPAFISFSFPHLTVFVFFMF